MPSIKTITPILGGSYYHLFNRGINKQLLFYHPGNYKYFLKLLDKHLSGYVHFLAYCLLPNHFHLIIKVKDVISFEGDDIPTTSEEKVGKLVSNQLRSMFISYSMAINLQENRTGNLFDRSFKRLEITKHDYLEYAIFYTHFNPEKHGIVDNYKNYKYSSYKALDGNKKTKMDRKLVYRIFGDKEDFIHYHNGWHHEKESIIIE